MAAYLNNFKFDGVLMLKFRNREKFRRFDSRARFMLTSEEKEERIEAGLG